MLNYIIIIKIKCIKFDYLYDINWSTSKSKGIYLYDFIKE